MMGESLILRTHHEQPREWSERMTRMKARAIVGTHLPRWILRAQAETLQLRPWANTTDEWQRLCALKALGYKVTTMSPEGIF